MPTPAQSYRPLFPYDFRPAERNALLHFETIAAKIKMDPSLLAIPLANIARWLARGHSSRARLEGWRAMIEAAQREPAAFEKLLALLVDESPDAMQWKGFSPFTGILNREELDRLSWSSSH